MSAIRNRDLSFLLHFISHSLFSLFLYFFFLYFCVIKTTLNYLEEIDDVHLTDNSCLPCRVEYILVLLFCILLVSLLSIIVGLQYSFLE